MKRLIKGKQYIIENKDTAYDFDNDENIFEYLYKRNELYWFTIISNDADMIKEVEWCFDKEELINIKDKVNSND